MRVLAIDPGTVVSGYACVEAPSIYLSPSSINVLSMGVVKLRAKLELNVRIAKVYETFSNIVKKMSPDVCVLEKSFFGINAQSALKLGLVRGALIAASANQQVPVKELSPTRAKKLITGQGHADKSLVANALRTLLQIDFPKDFPHDATDALSLAFAFLLISKHQ